MWRSYAEGEVRLLSDTATMRPAGGPHWRASPPRKPHQSHHYHHNQHQQQQQQVPVKADTEEQVIQPKTTTTSTPAAAATSAGQNPNVRRANAIDRYSRVVFPVVFTTFSIAYWAVYINASSSMVNLAEFVVE